MRSIRWLAPMLVVSLVVVACGRGEATVEPEEIKRPSIVVTTSILGDVVSSMVGDAAEVTTIMPPGASPHDFQASAAQGQVMRTADLLIVNGVRFEEGILDVIDAAEHDGVRVYEAIAAVDTMSYDDGHSHVDEHEHAVADDGDQHSHVRGHDHEAEGHEHSGVDPHFFTDPARMAAAARGILNELVENVSALDTDQVHARAERYISDLENLDAEVESILKVVSQQNRVLITNHEVFGYFADRYNFEVIGTVIPSGTTTEGTNASDLAELVRLIRAEGVRAIFADTSSPDRLARTLASEVGDVEVVELYSESLGEPGSDAATYIDMVRTDAERIAAALA